MKSWIRIRITPFRISHHYTNKPDQGAEFKGGGGVGCLHSLTTFNFPPLEALLTFLVQLAAAKGRCLPSCRSQRQARQKTRPQPAELHVATSLA